MKTIENKNIGIGDLSPTQITDSSPVEIVFPEHLQKGHESNSFVRWMMKICLPVYGKKMKTIENKTIDIPGDIK